MPVDAVFGAVAVTPVLKLSKKVVDWPRDMIDCNYRLKLAPCAPPSLQPHKLSRDRQSSSARHVLSQR